jgi:hypothetical protein
MFCNVTMSVHTATQFFVLQMALMTASDVTSARLLVQQRYEKSWQQKGVHGRRDYERKNTQPEGHVSQTSLGRKGGGSIPHPLSSQV